MRKVWKVVNREGRRLVSAQAPHWRDRWPELVPFIRTYMSANYRRVQVAGCMAFRSLSDALSFVGENCHGWDDADRDAEWQPEVWECECESARAIKVFAIGSPGDFRAFAEAGGRPGGWISAYRAPPPGTLYCKNLRLVKRVEDSQ